MRSSGRRHTYILTSRVLRLTNVDAFYCGSAFGGVGSLGISSEIHFFRCKGCDHVHTIEKKYSVCYVRCLTYMQHWLRLCLQASVTERRSSAPPATERRGRYARASRKIPCRNRIGITTGLPNVIVKRSLHVTQLHARAISRTAKAGGRLPTILMRKKKLQNKQKAKDKSRNSSTLRLFRRD